MARREAVTTKDTKVAKGHKPNGILFVISETFVVQAFVVRGS